MTTEERLVTRIMREYTAAFEGASEWAARVAGARGIMSGGALAYEMDWSANAYRDAAHASVCQEILTAMWHRIDTDTPLTTEKLRQEAYDRVSRGARYPSRSTSVPSNLMAEERLSTWAKILEWADESLMDIKEVSQGCRASDEGVGPALPPSSHHAGPALRYATSVPGVRVVRDPKREVLKGGSREPGQEDC
jgi:hypothetical protein